MLVATSPVELDLAPEGPDDSTSGRPPVVPRALLRRHAAGRRDRRRSARRSTGRIRVPWPPPGRCWRRHRCREAGSGRGRRWPPASRKEGPGVRIAGRIRRRARRPVQRAVGPDRVDAAVGGFRESAQQREERPTVPRDASGVPWYCSFDVTTTSGGPPGRAGRWPACRRAWSRYPPGGGKEGDLAVRGVDRTAPPRGPPPRRANRARPHRRVARHRRGGPSRRRRHPASRCPADPPARRAEDAAEHLVVLVGDARPREGRIGPHRPTGQELTRGVPRPHPPGEIGGHHVEVVSGRVGQVPTASPRRSPPGGSPRPGSTCRPPRRDGTRCRERSRPASRAGPCRSIRRRGRCRPPRPPGGRWSRRADGGQDRGGGDRAGELGGGAVEEAGVLVEELGAPGHADHPAASWTTTRTVNMYLSGRVDRRQRPVSRRAWWIGEQRGHLGQGDLGQGPGAHPVTGAGRQHPPRRLGRILAGRHPAPRSATRGSGRPDDAGDRQGL